jgi:cytochrome c553
MRLILILLVSALLAATAPLGAQSPQARADRDREFVEGAYSEPDLTHGEELFQTCAACHGADGLGTSDGEIPAIAGQHGSVLLKQLTDFRHEQRWNERMQYFTDRHALPTAQDLTDVAAYIASLPRFPATAKGIGDGSSLGEGAKVYFRRCERCHGPLGEGEVFLGVPRLAGQHYGYLVRQLEETAINQRPGMGDDHVELLRKLSKTQRSGVADYLSRTSPDLSSKRSQEKGGRP